MNDDYYYRLDIDEIFNRYDYIVNATKIFINKNLKGNKCDDLILKISVAVLLHKAIKDSFESLSDQLEKISFSIRDITEGTNRMIGIPEGLKFISDSINDIPENLQAIVDDYYSEIAAMKKEGVMGKNGFNEATG